MTAKPLTTPVADIFADLAANRSGYAKAALREAVQELIEGELFSAKLLLRDVARGAVGFERLAKLTGIPAKSLMRMLSPDGNPRAENLAAIIVALQAELGVRLTVGSEAAE
jgi:DNA-binding phage protein